MQRQNAAPEEAFKMSRLTKLAEWVKREELQTAAAINSPQLGRIETRDTPDDLPPFEKIRRKKKKFKSKERN